MYGKESRKYSITVFGATGFTGKLVARYLDELARAGRLPEPDRVCLAGRDMQKLEAVRSTLCPNLAPSLRVADVGDQASLDRMAHETRVVLACVGPFALYGEGAVRACATHGTDYLDITGEVRWVAEMEAKYGALAERTGALLIPFAGHDCVPSDVTAWFTRAQVHPEELARRHATLLVTARLPLRAQRVSGGTLKSAIGFMAEGKVAYAEPVVVPHARLSDAVTVIDELPKEHGGPVVVLPNRILPDGLVMARSYAREQRPGDGVLESKFAMAVPGRLAGSLMKLGFVVAPLVLRIGFLKRWFERWAERAGAATPQGASKHGYDMLGLLKLYARDAAPNAAPLQTILTRVHCDCDSYDMTAVYCVQIALALAEPSFRKRCPRAGFHTPVSAIGGRELLARCGEHMRAEVITAGARVPALETRELRPDSP